MENRRQCSFSTLSRETMMTSYSLSLCHSRHFQTHLISLPNRWRGWIGLHLSVFLYLSLLKVRVPPIIQVARHHLAGHRLGSSEKLLRLGQIHQTSPANKTHKEVMEMTYHRNITEPLHSNIGNMNQYYVFLGIEILWDASCWSMWPWSMAMWIYWNWKGLVAFTNISPTAKSGRIEPMNPWCAAWITQTLGTPMEIQWFVMVFLI